MTDPTNDIDSLLRMLNQDGWENYHAALTALVAERDALRKRVEEWWILRERLVESALRGVNVSGLHRSEAELIGKASVWMVDATLAAMRKGEQDGN
jgi:hypothetical protein